MNVRETGHFAWQGVTANKTRSALTTLGVLIGVAAVIILVAVGTGSSKAVQDSISALGSNTLTITADSGGGGGGPGGGGGFPGGGLPGGGLFGGEEATTSQNATSTRTAELTMDDAEAVATSEEADHVLGLAPVVSASSVTATFEGASHDVSTFTGTTASYLLIDNSSVQYGTAFTDDDYTSRRRVALVGQTVAEELVGSDLTEIVGTMVSFNGFQFEVLGVLSEKGSTGPTDSDDRVIAPATSVQDTLSGYGALSSISVKATSADDVTVAQNEIQAILDARHGVSSSDRDYSVSSASSILEAATSSNQTFTVLLGAVAAISLLVGGIGVMNIMLVTVTERTREIGIRKAIGASRADIIGQFLAEAVLLSLFGGVVGVAAGLIGSQFTIVGVEPVVAPYSVFLAFGVAVLIGLFFGLYPANRAAALRPIEALRYE
ncbi:peptide ABC transporter permease [Nocardioides szechwanensis]|uniref:Putative ABC transport system permease protein n=1 Tax=Nocardioides szechwanensis TaxID=1005944 RepID=A0A1H0H945_9ACTN|nr:ABC transporter permease [Nocardioides szechwanensis]GEP34223.1 peptide ABC transporter permease [Nocardioides szechwanensis]SDO15665.1 putative ABC transport system permease protein [Nocardioides szechwanensis]